MEVAELAAALADPDVEVRRGAIMQLPEALGELAIAPLLGGLGDPDWRVREEAVRAGKRLAERTELAPALVEAVSQGTNVGLRNAAIELLGLLAERAVPALVAALPRADDSARRFLVEALASGGDGHAREALIDAMASPDPNLVVAAMAALAQIGGERARAALLAVLDRRDSYLSTCALEGLGRMNAELPFDALHGLLSDKLVRRAALEALGRSRDPRAPGVLVQALHDGSPRVVQTASRALDGWLAGSQAAELLAESLRELEPAALQQLRELAGAGDLAAVNVLLWARDGAGLDIMLQLCAAQGSAEQGWLRAMGAWGEPGIGALLERARTGSERVCAVALELACHLVEAASPAGVEAVRAALRGALGTADADVRQAALEGLARWAETEDAPAIAARCLDEAPQVAAEAAQALLALGGREPAAVREALARLDLGAFGQPTLMRLLVLLEGEAALARLQQALTHHAENVRVAAVDALVTLGTPTAAEVIVLSLADESEDVQAAAARALGELSPATGQTVAVEPLLLALDNAAPAVQAAAAAALGRLGDPRGLAALRERLRLGEPLVQLAAIEALRRFSGPELGELMVEALGHPDTEVVKQALHGIAERPHPRTAARLGLALGHSSWDVRQLAATLLGELDAASATGPLQARLGHEEDALVRAAIESALGRLGEGG
jgi:HEAT repeat protein